MQDEFLLVLSRESLVKRSLENVDNPTDMQPNITVVLQYSLSYILSEVFKQMKIN